MGVHGLWRLIEPSGKPVPLETLENKVLAIDVSIWLHQAIKGFQDAKGAPLQNAHLLGIYHRVCKLLYFRVKPVFVFDGGVPVLKKQTIAKRNQLKLKNTSEAERLHRNLLESLLKHTAISKVLSEKAIAEIESSPTKKPASKTNNEDDLYFLPPSQLDSTVSSSSEDGDEESARKSYDLHSIDTKSAQFKSLPVDLRHEILTDLKETRKQSSWGRLHELPRQSGDFSSYQMSRLLKRQSVQSALEEAEKEMGGHSLSLGELEQLLKDQGVITHSQNLGTRIASDENTRFLLIKNIKSAIAEAKKHQTNLDAASKETNEHLDVSLQQTEKIEENSDSERNKGEKEFESDLERAIALSMQDEPSTSSKSVEIPENKQNAKIEDFAAADFYESESSDEDEPVESVNKLSSAQNYMMEYSGLTPNEIAKIISEQGNKAACESHRKNNKVEVISSDGKEEAEVDTVEIMSDSESSCDDFLDVELVKEKVAAGVMEVVIKPDEDLEDDLFKDIFSENKQEEGVSETLKTQNKTVEEKDSFELSAQQEITHKTAPEQVQEEITKNIAEKNTERAETLQKTAKERPKLSTEQMTAMQETLRQEQAELSSEKARKERLATNITDQMYQEAQELLELFGVPYLIAPMEAEAQCAFLELIELTDGTITDDSDIWLFGGRTVYKNFFNQAKTVMEFKSENIQHHFKLTREQMILLAMLVGSDYTTGLAGVGPVTGLEILAAFPPKSQILSGLMEFKRWLVKGKVVAPGRATLRNKLKNVNINENFPNPQILQAYLEPTVETSREKFTWGKPDVIGLVDFAKRKFGWTQKRTDDILNPVLKRLEDKTIQKSIRDYFKMNVKVVSCGETEARMSKRVKTAVKRIGAQNNGEEEDTEPGMKKKRGTKKKTDEDIEVLRKTKVQSKKKVKEICEEIEGALKNESKVKLVQNLHVKEVIPQKQREKTVIMRNKLKAIETFRKSKKGPGFVQKRKADAGKKVKEDAGYLSESSSSD